MTARLAFVLSLLLTGAASLWLLTGLSAGPAGSRYAIAPQTLLILHGFWCWWAAVWLAQGPGTRDLLYGGLALLTAPAPLYAVLWLAGYLDWPTVLLAGAAMITACYGACLLTRLVLHRCSTTASRRLFAVLLQVAPLTALPASPAWDAFAVF